jgi:hypothetical protein
MVIFTQVNVKIELRRPRFHAFNVYKKPPKRGSGFYHSWSKLMKKKYEWLLEGLPHRVLCHVTCPWTLLDWTSSTVSPYECPWWKSLFEVWKLYHTRTARNMSMWALGIGSVQRGHGIWIWISIVEKFLLSFEIFIPCMDCHKHVHAWVWKSVCLLHGVHGVHFACLPTPDRFHPFAKFVTSVLPSCQIHAPLVHDVAKFTSPLLDWELAKGNFSIWTTQCALGYPLSEI